MTISAAKAVPVYGTFSGIVIHSAITSDGYYNYAYGTPVTGTYEYSPTLLTGNSTHYSDPTASFQISVDGQELYSWSGNNLNLSVDANGMPVSGSGAGVWDLFLNTFGPGTMSVDVAEYSISAQVIYSAPSDPSAMVPDTASTSCLMGVAMLCLAVFGRLTFHSRKDRPSAR
jgi:hypothetical protein